MKKTLILFFIFILLGGGVYWYTQKGNEQLTTVKTNDRNFAVKDVSQIGKIFIADRTGVTTTLERKGDDWIYNEKYKARKNAVQNVLIAINGLQVKFIPPKASVPLIVKTLASHGVKVEVYDLKGENIRTFYIGGVTNDERATYMIMENAEQPYAMHIPTMDGGLRARFSLRGDEWRDKNLFDVEPEEIDFVSIEYPKQKNKSFKLERKPNGFSVTPFYDVTPKMARNYKKGSGEAYLMQYTRLNAEAFENEKSSRDSISAMIPFAVVTIKKKNGEIISGRFHSIRAKNVEAKPTETNKASSANAIERYNVDHSSGDFLLVQHLLFGKIFWSYESFFEE